MSLIVLIIIVSICKIDTRQHNRYYYPDQEYDEYDPEEDYFDDTKHYPGRNNKPKYYGYVNDIEGRASNPESLCDNPVINSADVMLNGTVRLYRDNLYWDLYGMPDRVGWLTKPKTIKLKNYGPVTEKTSIMSMRVGNRKGYTFKFEPGKWWAWMASGQPWKGGEKGEKFQLNSLGFDTVFHNEREDEPLMIALKDGSVYYYSTKGYYISEAKNYGLIGYQGGKNGENFPRGVQAAFSWPSTSANRKYNVFLFKQGTYCYRPDVLKSGVDCDQWRDSRELFGCFKGGEKL